MIAYPIGVLLLNGQSSEELQTKNWKSHYLWLSFMTSAMKHTNIAGSDDEAKPPSLHRSGGM